jgi:hypothetical protein
MEQERIEELLKKINECNEETFGKLKRALGTASREEAADLVTENPQAAKTAFEIFSNEIVPGATTAEKMYPSAAKRKPKIQF